MDFDQNDLNENKPEDPAEPQETGPASVSPPSATPYNSPYNYPPRSISAATGQRRSGWRILWGVFTVFSIMGNLFLLVLLMGSVALIAAGGQQGGYHEKLVQAGSGSDKIVVIALEGVIDSAQSERFAMQLRAVRKDRDVRGLIVRVNSPGGGVSASDEIYHQIRTFREEEGLPVVAFMQSIAASGGYYASVACDKIVAQPTTITGSIGVIMAHLVLEELLKEKLGILPVVIKSGPKKDWPSSFKTPTKEQLDYLSDKLVMPAYNRFVDVVADGRQEVLTRPDVVRLADGAIYNATEAHAEKLIDNIGYMRDAIDLVESLAGIMDAEVVEYREIFSFFDLLATQSRSAFKIDRNALQKWATPELMYLWRPY
ncbi:signal peptide peptidase SppA [Planctomycetota bacterium]